jgi:chromosome segregation ATPase
MATAVVSADEFLALEHKVLQTVELIKKEREARAHAEAERNAAQAELAALREQMHTHAESASSATRELETLQRERDAVKQRVEAMLAQMDELL